MDRDGCEVEEPFKIIGQADMKQLSSLLKSRLPRSADVMNMVLATETFPSETQVYTLDGDLSGEAVVMATFSREDYGQDITFSVSESCVISSSLRRSFEISDVIQWKKIHRICADRLISSMIMEIEVLHFNNVVSIHPNFMYPMEVQDALSLDVETGRLEVVVKPLDVTTALKFIQPVWRYWRNGSEKYLAKLISKHLSAGVYVDGILVSCAVANCHGLIGTLNTSSNHERKGYGKLCMKFLLKQMAQHGFVPTSSSTKENYPSVILHEKSLGMKVSHECDFIFHLPYIT